MHPASKSALAKIAPATATSGPDATRTANPIPATCFPFGIGDPPCAPRFVEPGGEFADRRIGGLPMADEVRRLGPADAAAWRALRLEALERHPEAFGGSLHEERALPAAAWGARLERTLVFGIGSGPSLRGCAGLFIEQMQKKRHKGVLWGVYVRSEARGQGLGRILVERVIAAARDHVRQLHTAVVTDNLAARKLYRDLGFAAYGIEPRALEVDGRYLDEELLVLHLDGAWREGADSIQPR